jgi:Na+/alanine symporter
MIYSTAASKAMMAMPNIISLLVLNKVITEETRLHLWNKT